MIIGEERPFTAGTAVKSVLNFILNYVILLGIVLLMVFLNNMDDFSKYLSENLSVLFFTVGCLFLLSWIIYLYYFFDRKSFLTEMKNIWLLFLLLDVCIAVTYLSGFYIDIYARPAALLALLADRKSVV